MAISNTSRGQSWRARSLNPPLSIYDKEEANHLKNQCP